MAAAEQLCERGALIVLEGCDHSGKTTQCINLVAALNNMGRKVQMLRFPDRTTAIGQMINSYLTSSLELSDQAVHLLFSANRWEAVASMKKLLSQGITLVVDRYAFSGVAFTAAKGLDVNWCRQPDIGLLAPDLTIFLDLPVEVAAERGTFGEERYEKREFQEKVYTHFQAMTTPDWKVIDAQASVDAIGQEMIKLALATMNDIGSKPFSYLWTEDSA